MPARPHGTDAMSSTTLTEADEGKRVMTAEGNELGMVVEVREGTPYVEVDPNVFERVKAKFDWGEPGKDAYPLETADVATVTDDEVRLR